MGKLDYEMRYEQLEFHFILRNVINLKIYNNYFDVYALDWFYNRGRQHFQGVELL